MGLYATQVGLIITWAIFSSLSTAVIILRLYDRRHIHKAAFVLDDYMAIFSLVCALCLLIMVLLWTTCYDLGASIVLTAAERRNFQIMYYVARIFYGLAFNAAKISIMLFYIKVTNRLSQRTYWLVLIGLLGFLIFDAIFHLLVLMIPCVPVQNYWNVGPDSGSCWSTNTSATVINIFTFLSEATIFLAPVPMLWLAGLSGRQRIALGGMFSLASLIILASALKLVNIINASGKFPAHDLGTAWIWIAVECNTAILVAGFLPLKALLEGTFFAMKRRFSSPDTSVTGDARQTSIAPSDPYDLNLIATLQTYPDSPQSATMTLCNDGRAEKQGPKDMDHEKYVGSE